MYPKPPLISVIIPALNAGKYLNRAVKSLLDTSYPALDIIIINDGSKDDTALVAEILKKQNPENIQSLSHPGCVNKGVSSSRNLGIANAKGELISFLDADDYVLPHRFTKAVEILTEYDDVDGVHEFTRMDFENDDLKSNWWNTETFGFTESVPPDELLSELLKGKCWATSGILLKKKVLEKTGVFETKFKIAEDCNLWFKLASISKIVSGNLDQPVSAYCRHSVNTYQKDKLENRFSMIESIINLYKWSRKISTRKLINKKKHDEIWKSLNRYLQKTLVYSFNENNLKMARYVLFLHITTNPLILLNISTYRFIFRSFIG